jgi:hypothetical protein
MTNAIAALAPADGITKAACAALGLSRASVQRRRAIQAKPPRLPRPRQQPPRALNATQRQIVLDLLHEPRFADQVPAKIFATDTKLVLAHLDIDAKSNEIPAAQALLAELGIAEDAIVTLDALHCQKNSSRSPRTPKSA